MRLRNKKTGERGIINYFDNQCIVIYPIDKDWNAKGDKRYIFHSLAELNEEWEDVPEEPKEYWAIDQFGEPINVSGLSRLQLAKLRQYGNDFETKEEAEKAVEKLKAWKRLKGKGFRFTNWEFRDVLDGDLVIEAKLNFDDTSNILRDLEVCFGGEE